MDSRDLSNPIVKIWEKASKKEFFILKALIAYYNPFENNITDSGFFFVNKLSHRLSE